MKEAPTDEVWQMLVGGREGFPRVEPTETVGHPLGSRFFPSSPRPGRCVTMRGGVEPGGVPFRLSFVMIGSIGWTQKPVFWKKTGFSG